MGFIYKITNIVNNKVYIGQTTRTIELRWKQHLKDAKNGIGHCTHLYSAINKYGINNFIIEELEECDNNLLDEKEKEWIKFYNSYESGYNLTIGGMGNKRRNDDDEIYECFLKGMNQTQISEKFNCCLGTVRAALIAKGITDEQRKSQSKNHLKKPVAKIDLNSNKILEIFPSVSEAAKTFNEENAATHIARVCRGVRKSTRGYRWQYLENINLEDYKDE